MLHDFWSWLMAKNFAEIENDGADWGVFFAVKTNGC
jgi:hypothetical protein